MQKKKKILKELQKVERQLQLKTQQQFTKEYMEAKGLKDDLGQPAGVESPAAAPANPPHAGPLPSDCEQEVEGCCDDEDGLPRSPVGEEGEEEEDYDDDDEEEELDFTKLQIGRAHV